MKAQIFLSMPDDFFGDDCIEEKVEVAE